MATLELPQAFQFANHAAIRAQRRYIAVTLLNLIFLTAAAACGMPIFSTQAEKTQQNTFIAFLLILATMLSFHAKNKQYDRIWYKARARAESIKSIAWKFVMHAEPYSGSDVSALNTYCEDLKAYRDDAKYVSLGIAPTTEKTGMITDSMRDLRARDWSERLTCYRIGRVEDQHKWYLKRASDHQRWDTISFVALVIVQVTVIGLAMLRIGSPDLPSASVGVVSSMSSAIIALTALRRYGELIEAYSSAAHDLDLVLTRAATVIDEASLVAWANDAENAISREHTSWLARREVK